MKKIYNFFFTTRRRRIAWRWTRFSVRITVVLQNTIASNVITVYSPSCLGQETAKGPFGLRAKLPLDLIEPESTASVADALSTRPLIGKSLRLGLAMQYVIMLYNNATG